MASDEDEVQKTVTPDTVEVKLHRSVGRMD